MKLFAKISFAILIACGISNACNKPSTFGSDILPDEDNVDIRYTDTISMESATIRRDSIVTYSSSIQFLNNLCGEIDDPIFGKSYSQIFSQLRLGPKTDTSIINNAVLDSTVMRVTFSKGTQDFKRQFFDFDKHAGIIGFGVDLHKVDAPIIPDSSYYSNGSLPIGERFGGFKINDIEAVVGPYASQHYIEFGLSDDLWNELTGYSNRVFYSDVTLQEVLNGVAFVPTGTDLSNEIYGMASLNFNGQTYIVFHFHTDEEPHLTQVMTVNSTAARTLNFEQEKDGTIVDQFAQDPALSDSLVFIQGMAGWDTQIDFPYIDKLGDIAVNSAKLQLTVHSNDEMEADEHPGLLIAAYENEEGNLIIIEDILGNSGGLLATYGGIKNFRADENGNAVYFYELDITKHFQRLIEKDFTNPSLYISAFNKQESATRVVLGGAGNTTEGMKLKLTYTKL